MCNCCSVCASSYTSGVRIALLAYLVHAWSAARTHHVHQSSIAVQKVSATRTFYAQKCLAGAKLWLLRTLMCRKSADCSNFSTQQCFKPDDYPSCSYLATHGRTSAAAVAFPHGTHGGYVGICLTIAGLMEMRPSKLIPPAMACDLRQYHRWDSILTCSLGNLLRWCLRVLYSIGSYVTIAQYRWYIHFNTSFLIRDAISFCT